MGTYGTIWAPFMADNKKQMNVKMRRTLCLVNNNYEYPIKIRSPLYKVSKTMELINSFGLDGLMSKTKNIMLQLKGVNICQINKSTDLINYLSS